MKNILKLILVSLIIPLILNSCKRESYDDDWTTVAPSFKLYDSGISTNVLYPSMANNPFQLVWDSYGTSQNYNIVLSSNAEFTNLITLGTSTTNSYTTTVDALNTALLQAGYSPFSSKTVYIRIQTAGSGSNLYVSNVISFTVTPYPTTAPVITSPTNGSSFVLDKNNASSNVTTITWSDYASYGVSVTYLVELAPSGTNNFVTLGSVVDLKSLDVTNKAFNDAVLKAGLIADVKAAIDIRVTATTASAGGNISKTSSIVTINVTPYVAFKNLYLVGDGTSAGWSPNNSNQAIFRDPATLTQFHFVGYFGTSQFKLLEVLGQWQPQWGTNSAGTVAVNDGTGSDPGTFAVASSGYYNFTMDIVAKTYTFTPYDATSAPFYGQISLIGDFNGWGGDLDLTQSSFDPHQWYATNVTLTTGGVKFRAEHDWPTNWGAGTELSGIGTNGGANIPTTAGTYNVFFDDIDGSYLFVKQ